MVRLTKKEKVIMARIKLYNKWFNISHIFPANIWERNDLKAKLLSMLNKTEKYILKNYYGQINFDIFNAIKNGTNKYFRVL